MDASKGKPVVPPASAFCAKDGFGFSDVKPEGCDPRACVFFRGLVATTGKLRAIPSPLGTRGRSTLLRWEASGSGSVGSMGCVLLGLPLLPGK